ncbi:MAG: hypothetical protein RIQ52_1057 [Pseudomonadota bacterium]|jgi:predicted amidohydrolase
MTDTSTLPIAAAQYDIGFFHTWEQYREKARQWVGDAAGHGARMLVFPEYFSMELASLFGESVYSSLSLQLESMQSILPDFMMLYADLAEEFQVHIQAGTYPVRDSDGFYRNRAFLFRPDGSIDHQDKLQMTRFENELWHITAGDAIKVLDTPWGPVGISVCYDSEFPLIARRQTELGARVILAPSCTDTLAGYYRVRIGCQARALENQCYVIQSPTVGHAPWSEAVDVNTGAAAIYTPVDRGFPDDGIMAQGTLNQTQWVYASLDLSRVQATRENGQVLNYRDWSLQQRLV